MAGRAPGDPGALFHALVFASGVIVITPVPRDHG
jgi:hypothetical protein